MTTNILFDRLHWFVVVLFCGELGTVVLLPVYVVLKLIQLHTYVIHTGNNAGMSV